MVKISIYMKIEVEGISTVSPLEKRSGKPVRYYWSLGRLRPYPGGSFGDNLSKKKHNEKEK